MPAPLDKLREQIRRVRDCADELADLAPEIPDEREAISLIAQNLRLTADYATKVLARNGSTKVSPSGNK